METLDLTCVQQLSISMILTAGRGCYTAAGNTQNHTAFKTTDPVGNCLRLRVD